ncbi:ABC transporter ATP-binding protein [Caminicella sporogenes]|uniref:ABC transporter ATP-binding protein n=1 Tax=Caminicella sporogenes TaxID=166485 RepID=UPI002541BF06|nr:ABC transporter ATP-binding protein [Caminicella sporogenes]WIF96086.1 ABC transporter ATP-binding protein [Caminicella sporogenes]
MRNIAIKAEKVNLKYRFIRNVNIKHEIIRSFFKKNRKDREVKEVWALKNLSFEIESGQTVGVIGSNGSGKTTLLKVIAGVFKPDSGELKLNSDSVSLLTLGAGFQNELSGYENIYISGLLLGLTREEIDNKIENIIEFSELGDSINNPLKTYSSGMKSRLAFSISSQIEPDILLIDEVLGVGDQAFKEKSYKRMQELILDRNRTVVLVSHSKSTIKNLCDKVLWIEKGEYMGYGETEEILKEYDKYMKNK